MLMYKGTTYKRPITDFTSATVAGLYQYNEDDFLKVLIVYKLF